MKVKDDQIECRECGDMFAESDLDNDHEECCKPCAKATDWDYYYGVDALP